MARPVRGDSDLDKIMKRQSNLQKQVEQNKRSDKNTKYTGVSNGRLTLSDTLPVTTDDLTNQQTLYYLPYLGNKIFLLQDNGNLNHAWRVARIPDNGFSIDLSSLDVGVYDIGGYWDKTKSGGLNLETLAWTNTSTRAVSLIYQDGRLCYPVTNENTRVYIGSIYIEEGGYCSDSDTKRFVWNMYNRIEKRLYGESTSNYVTGQTQFINGMAVVSGAVTLKLQKTLGYNTLTNASGFVFSEFIC